MKTELEEAAEKYGKTPDYMSLTYLSRSYAFIEGAKWQQQNSYSEEEVLVLLHKRMTHTLGEEYKEETTLEWFKQFKKK